MLHSAAAKSSPEVLLAERAAAPTLFDRRAMLVTSGVYLTLSWLPYFGALAGGVAGGLNAPNLRSALVAALLPAAVNFLFLGALSGIAPDLWARRWLAMSLYGLLLVGGALGAAAYNNRARAKIR